MAEKQQVSTDMLLGEIKARLEALSKQLAVLESHVSKGHDKLEDRVTELEKDYNRMKGIFAAALFVGTVVIPVLTKKAGF